MSRFTPLQATLAAAALAIATPAMAVPGPMVATAHPRATEAGVEILRAGGNAVDAAIAASLMLGVVEPQASGLGGGGFLLFYDAAADDISGYDFRETAPMAITNEALSINGRLNSRTASQGGVAIATPGLLAGLIEVHERHGRLPLDVIVAPAVRTAREGHPVNEYFVSFSTDNLDKILNHETTAETYLKDGLFVYEVGDILFLKQLADVLERIPTEKRDVVYGEESATRISAAVREAGGVMQPTDLMNYRPRTLGLLRSTYRDVEIVLPAGPSAGGVKTLAALELLKPYPMGALCTEQPVAYHSLIAAALSVSIAGADETVADPAFAPGAAQKLLEPEWLVPAGERVARVAEAARSAAPVEAAPAEPNRGQTTHLSIIDAHGNAIALTQTINFFFGSGVTVPGMQILMNNEMADFTFTEGHINAPAPGKVPRSNMAPQIVLRDGSVVATIGSPGGSRIPSALVQVLSHRVDADTSLADAISAPRLHVDPARRVLSYEETLDRETMEAVTNALGALDGNPWSMTQRSANDAYFGGVQGIWERNGDSEGAADPRRAGTAMAP